LSLTVSKSKDIISIYKSVKGEDDV